MEPAATPASGPTSIGRTVTRNSFWYSVELGFEIVVGFSTSIAMARLIGPTQLGYFNLIMWLINMSGVIGNLGVPLAARKYMAEFMGRGENGKARAVYERAFQTQVKTALLITAAGLGVVMFAGDPQYRLMASFMMLSLLPNMVLAIPSQANMAREDTRSNVWASLVGQTLYIVFVIASLLTHWNLLGIAIGICIYRTVEMFVRLLPVQRWVRQMPVEELDSEMKLRLRNFSGQSMVLLIVNVLVWNRSDMLFLKWLSADTAQISFYAASFNLTERALTLPRILGTASGVTLMVQYGRDITRMGAMLDTTARYLLLCSIPVLGGLAALSPAIIRLLYGPLYEPAVPVLAMAGLFGIMAAMAPIASQALQSFEKLKLLIGITLAAALVDIALDIALIPRYGAWGASLANGGGQLVAALGLWWAVGRQCKLNPAWGTMVRIVVCGLIMMAVLIPVGRMLAPWLAVAAGVPVGALVYGGALKALRVLEQRDVNQLSRITERLPGRLGRKAHSLLAWMAQR